ncbi:hypothetical protein [Parafrankia sp. EUN1f]|uniref:hypothetical protein n=1 Tax=Parafrankia sp. EUN1f TaxID=102897 RepID=UPI0001C468EC|nr:hypothetical protein [Parafrankia sp. EUN1f]EFC80368.1 hypothetical protein FrEUN1fDRAFT_6499 [Parafrankia sp. EUN1f]
MSEWRSTTDRDLRREHGATDGEGPAAAATPASDRRDAFELTATPDLTEIPDLCGAYPRLSDDQIAALAVRGERRQVRAGEVLLREGRPPGTFPDDLTDQRRPSA